MANTRAVGASGALILLCVAVLAPHVVHARIGGSVDGGVAAGVTKVPVRYGWVRASKVGMQATAVIGGSHGSDSYGVCRVKDSGQEVVGKIIDTLGVTGCTYADPGSPTKDTTTLKDFDVLVSANLGAWQSTPPAAGQGVAVPVTQGSSTLVGRGIEDGSDVVPGSATLAPGGDGYVVNYGDHGKGLTATASDAQVLVNNGTCPDYPTSVQTCGDDRIITPGPDCEYARIIARPLDIALPSVADREGGPGASHSDFESLCLNHQAFVYVGAHKNFTSGFYGFNLRACAHIECGQGLLCNDVYPGKYHWIESKDLCGEPSSYLDRGFTCAGLSAAEAAVRSSYDTCNVPTASPYELTLDGHNCHNYVIDVVNAYDKMNGDAMGPGPGR